MLTPTGEAKMDDAPVVWPYCEQADWQTDRRTDRSLSAATEKKSALHGNDREFVEGIYSELTTLAV